MLRSLTMVCKTNINIDGLAIVAKSLDAVHDHRYLDPESVSELCSFRVYLLLKSRQKMATRRDVRGARTFQAR